MRVASLEVFPVAIPFREPYLTASGSLAAREMAIVRLTDGEGITGHGDAVPLSLRGGPSLGRVIEQLESVAGPLVAAHPLEALGEATDVLESVAAVVTELELAGVGPQVRAAVEISLLDLLGRARGEPIWELLGAASARPVECNGTLGAGEPGSVAEAAARLCGDGFRTLKVKVGAGADRARLLAVRKATGAEVALRADANGAWTVAGAREQIASMTAIRLELVEQPCASLEELAELRAGGLPIPVVADESVADAAGAERAAELGACDAATLKLAKVGGVRAAIAIADLVPSYLSSALDSPLGIAAAAHTAQALPGEGFAAGLAHGLATTGLFADNVADPEPWLGPRLERLTGPGLGVEVDPDALERLRIR